jgi:hypothetical protein
MFCCFAKDQMLKRGFHLNSVDEAQDFSKMARILLFEIPLFIGNQHPK